MSNSSCIKNMLILHGITSDKYNAPMQGLGRLGTPSYFFKLSVV